MRLRGAPTFGGPEKAGRYLRLFVKHVLYVQPTSLNVHCQCRTAGRYDPQIYFWSGPSSVCTFLFCDIRRDEISSSPILQDSTPTGSPSSSTESHVKAYLCTNDRSLLKSWPNALTSRIFHISIPLQLSIVFQVPVTHARSRTDPSVPFQKEPDVANWDTFREQHMRSRSNLQ